MVVQTRHTCFVSLCSFGFKIDVLSTYQQQKCEKTTHEISGVFRGEHWAMLPPPHVAHLFFHEKSTGTVHGRLVQGVILLQIH